MKSSRLAFFSALPLLLAVVSCATAEDPSYGAVADTRPHVDTSSSDVAVGVDTNPANTDSGGRDSSSPVDTGGSKDTGVVADTGVDPDTGSPDTFVDFDTGTTPDTTTGGGSPCALCTGTCSAPLADEPCLFSCFFATGCEFDDTVSPAVCTCIP